MKKSTRIAVGGVSSAMCLTLLFLTGMVPFSSYIFPGMAGILLALVARENGIKTAFMLYVSTSLLGLFLIADRQAVFMFILLLGYYPIIRPYFFALSPPLSFLCRLLVMNGACALFYVLMKILLQMENETIMAMRYGIYLFWGLAVATMLLYDYTLGRLAFLYEHFLRGRLIKGSGM